MAMTHRIAPRVHSPSPPTDPPMAVESWKVGELARRTGLTVRALHHYDEIGLLTPSGRTPAGHRIYTHADVERLQQVQSLRLMGLPLDEVKRLLDGAALSPRHVIDLHLAKLQEQIAAQSRLVERLTALATQLDRAEGVSMDDLCRMIEAMTTMEKFFTPEQLETLKYIRKLHQEGKGIKTITDILEREKRPSFKNRGWNRATVRNILLREGLLSIKQFDRTGAIRDTDKVAKRIAELRAKHMSFSEIGAQLTKENLMPPVGSKWHAQTVAQTWNTTTTYDSQKTIEIAVGLYRANYSLRKIGEELALRGLTPQRGGAWHAAQVRQLLLMAKVGS